MTNAQEWTGPVGDVWAREWQRTDRSFADLTRQLVPAILDIAPITGTAIDIGCGAGETALSLASARPNLTITGIDISEGLLNVARERAADLPNLRFIEGDAADHLTDHPAEHGPINLYISRHGVMFFDNPVSAFSKFHAAAAPDAALIFSCFRDWSLNAFAHDLAELTQAAAPDPDLPGPFAFADESKVRRLLSQAGWRDITATPVDFNYVAGKGVDPVADAMAFMTRIGPAARAIRDASEDHRPAILEGLSQICENRRRDDAIIFPAAAWIWSARA